MESKVIKNSTKNLWLKAINSHDEIIETNQVKEALLFDNDNEAYEISKTLNYHREDQFEVTEMSFKEFQV